LSFLPYLGFALLALAAILFATFALLRRKGSRKAMGLLAGAIALVLLGVGGGVYWMVGRPGLALRAAQGLETRDVRGLVPYLIQRVRQNPGDMQAWIFLGRAYVSSGDAEDSAKAFGRAVALSRLGGKEDASLDSMYGQTLVAAAGGAVDANAEAAFNEALKRNPRDEAARFYLGEAKAMRGDRAGALALWQGLLADVPQNSPLHQLLVDRVAALTAAGLNSGGGGPGGGAPDPRAMVAGLATRLKDHPDDAEGWQRLIRAYTVLGETAQAQEALATARRQFAASKTVLAALDAQARDLKLR
jgi:cytochrome c-type biogenesis protein CcmH